MSIANTSNCLTLTGWAQNPDFLNFLKESPTNLSINNLDYLNFDSMSEVEQEAKKLPSYKITIAWSLGALVACNLINKGLLDTKKLILLSPCYKFVGDDANSNKSQKEWEAIYNGFSNSYEGFMPGFQGLVAKGSGINDLKLGGYTKPKLKHWLEYLANNTLENVDFSNFPEAIFMHAKDDQVTNIKQSTLLSKFYGHSKVIKFDSGGHVLHLSQQKELIKLIA